MVSVLGWMIILYVAGILLLLAEFFVPGGILGAIGGIMIVSSGIWASYVYPDQAFAIVVGEFVGVLVAIVLGVFIVTKTNFASRLVLQDVFDQSKGYVSDTSDTSLLGAVGEVYSPLRPAGAIIVNKRRVSAVADGSYIEKGVQVRVIEVRGNRVVVERVEQPADPSA